MTFKENAKVNDHARVGIVSAKKYKCAGCGYITRNLEEMEIHKCPPEYKCGMCGLVGKSEDEIIDHLPECPKNTDPDCGKDGIIRYITVTVSYGKAPNEEKTNTT